ncbi:acyl carrier protein [Natronosporangium hydrolyticum]|uniref:Acyl carrier protein n=1 Tax=Natronosporangium hydrolyticum TaxID=2811111 RepID=A0A895YKI0_9ACTN|nr:acyl carrier protein [Natronosporangium hydrolyticum]QSB16009.1 acyl carrier protein [Natronosporangium hydrolyticum]
MWDDSFEQALRQYLPFLEAEDTLDSDTDLRDFGLDSLATVELLGRLENEYQVRFTEDALSLDSFRTPATLWDALSAAQRVAG